MYKLHVEIEFLEVNEISFHLPVYSVQVKNQGKLDRKNEVPSLFNI